MRSRSRGRRPRYANGFAESLFLYQCFFPFPAFNDTRHPTPDTLPPTLDTRHPTPDTRHPTPDTRHPTPYSLLPTPYPLTNRKVQGIIFL
ncbi:MAG: hypothetical protein F6J90_33035 [Moorea sp. SIOASIH]|uniref:hypothetical protein n=1 Tax=Moorena sp. SIOASIH TaxID=2607817 RepID=UPI0013BB233E|nr:hypothetical protein [Moorena sp. SIOASIH]NEO40901.1 hypothetical protein [Moorena sp. SIOASIH]